MKRWILVLVVMMTGCFTRPVNVSLLPTHHVSPPLYSGLKNFDVVSIDRNIYRGSQPTDKSDFQFIKSCGVKTILKLDTDTEGDDAEAELLGMAVVHIPVNFERQMFGPVPVESIKQFWRDHPKDVYVHCVHGEDRTGLAVYLYRLQNGVSVENARTEMLSHGFHKLLFGLWDAAKDN